MQQQQHKHFLQHLPDKLCSAGMLASIAGERPPSIETTSNIKDQKKLYDFVKFYAYGHGYRVGGIDGLVYARSVCQWNGVEHQTCHWHHVTRLPQPGGVHVRHKKQGVDRTHCIPGPEQPID